MSRDAVKKMSTVKRVAGFLLIGLVMIGSFTVTYYVMRFLSGPRESSETTGEFSIGAHIAFMFLGGSFFLAAGILLYVATLVTQCFTFNFNKPFWNSCKKKLYVIHIGFIILIGIGAAGFVSMVVTPILIVLGLPWIISFIVPFLVTVVLVQFLFIWINIWRPLEKSMVKKKMSAYGISQEVIDKGKSIGISNPARSSFKKLTMVEEDVGMFWFTADELRYRGDTVSFRIGRDKLIEIERAVDAGSMAAYGGNIDVIIRFKMDDGKERRLRLHGGSGWTLGSKARDSDRFAERLISWQQAGLGESR